MRGACFLIVVVSAALTAGEPAAADVSTAVSSSGSMTLTWHGDPARGCAERGVCDLAGSVTLPLEGGSGVSVSTGRLGSLADGIGFQLRGGTVRVLRGDPADPAGICTATGGYADVQAVARRTSDGRVLLRFLSDPFSGDALSGGACPGPLPEDLEAAMPVITVPAGPLRGGRLRITAAGTHGFVAGPFSGSLSYDLRMRVRRHVTAGRRAPEPAPSPGTDPAGFRPRSVLEVAYRVVAIDGTLGRSFAGARAPACEQLDACGVTGTQELRPGELDGESFLGFRASGPPAILRGRRGAASALAALRAGRLRLESSAGYQATGFTTTAVSARREGGPVCAESRPVEVPLTSTGAGDVLRISAGGQRFPLSGQPLRTHCAGPGGGGADVELARADVPLADLGARELQVVLAAPERIAGAWSIAPTSSVTVTLRRERVFAGVERELVD